jgi:hypothetical protein
MVVLTYIFFVSHAAWKAPLAGFGSIEAKCVLPNQGCTAPAQGTSFVDASGKAKQGTVTGLSTATTYDCYVIADPKLLKKDKCSKPVRITTLASPTLVYKSSVTPVTNGRNLPGYFTSRCFIGPTGNFTDCVNSGLDNDTVIFGGVVDPNKRFITFESYSVSDPIFDGNLTTCSISPAGIIDSNTCVTAHSPPAGYESNDYEFDSLARRVWFKLNATGARLLGDIQGKDSNDMTQRYLNEYFGDMFGTCAINAQGEYTGCTQSRVPGLSFIVGTSPDASGFYGVNATAKGTSFCQNDFSCSAVAGIPIINDAAVKPDYMKFLTDNVVYFVGSDLSEGSDNTSATYRCNVPNPTTFTNCQKVFEDPDNIQALLAPANNGLNVYIVEYDPSDDEILTFATELFVCDVNQVTGIFENCKPSNDPEFGGPDLIASYPIVF